MASMALRVDSTTRPTVRSLALVQLALPLAMLVVVAIAIPLLSAKRANLTSDESLYLAEAYNIAYGHGITYPSGDVVTHRPPLYPLVLAPVVRLAGPDAAYRVTRLIVLANALLLTFLVWRMAGLVAGSIAGFSASASAYLSGIGTTLYLDPLECTFMLLSLAALFEASCAPKLRWFATSGVMLGLAFLVKESAIQWAPLGVLAWLAVPSLRNRTGARGAFAFTIAFGAAVSPWWLWVWATTSKIFMLGVPSVATIAMLVASATGLALFAAAIATWPALQARHRPSVGRLAPFRAAALVLAWGAFMLVGLTRYATWPYPNDYLHSIPHYLSTVAPQAQPYLLLGAAWTFIAVVGVRGRQSARLLVCAALLFLPFALFAANRGLQLRDSLPLVYLSYAALGISAAAVIDIMRHHVRRPLGDAMLAAGLIAFGAAFAFEQAMTFQRQNDTAPSRDVRADSWQNPFERHIAGWLEANLPAGSRILSSRLYFSSLYVDTHGRFSIRQMPTVRVDIDPDRPGLLVPRSNLFRWGDEELRPISPGDQWLYLKQFPSKDYWVGLSQQELLEYIATHDIDYVVLTGEDAAFSSLSYADYFSGHRAFTLRYTEEHSSADQLFVFTVDRAKLTPRLHSTAIAPLNLAVLERQTDMSQAQLASALGTPLRARDQETGLSQREQNAALAGIDLGAAREP